VKGPARPGKRADLQRLSGQKLYPVIEFENGSTYREESKDMGASIRAGRLDEKRDRAQLAWRCAAGRKIPRRSAQSLRRRAILASRSTSGLAVARLFVGVRRPALAISRFVLMRGTYP
jgi:hypothetical protein